MIGHCRVVFLSSRLGNIPYGHTIHAAFSEKLACDLFDMIGGGAALPDYETGHGLAIAKSLYTSQLSIWIIQRVEQLSVQGVDLEKLVIWMDEQQLGYGPLEEVTPLSGGTQNILIRFSRAGRMYVLRRPPLHLRPNSNETMRREARVLAALKGSEVPHPDLIAACPDEDVIGACFYLMAPIDGFNPAAVEHLPEPFASDKDWQWKLGMDLIDSVARLGRLDPFEIELDGFGKLEGFLERQVPRWEAQLKSYEDIPGWPGRQGIPGVERVGNWLSANLPDNFQRGLLHGDYHLGNVMVHHDKPELAAIVDWELATLGDPMVDLGWLMATWPIDGVLADETVGARPWIGFPEIDDLVQRYGGVTGRDMANAKWYGVLGCYKLGIILEGTYARACAGKAPKATGDNLHARTVGLFTRALNWID